MSLSRKLVLTLVTTTTLCMVVFTFQRSLSMQALLTAEATTRLQAEIDRLCATLAEPVYKLDEEAVEGILLAAFLPTVAAIEVVDYGQEEAGPRYAFRRQDQAPVAWPAGQRLSGDSPVMQGEIMRAGVAIGHVSLHADLGPLADRLNEQLFTEIVRILILNTVLVTFILLLLRHWLLRPMAGLSAAAEDIAAGDLERPIAVSSQDEIGSMAASLVRLRDAIRGQIGDLQASNDQLAASRSDLQTTLDSIGDAVITTDTGGRITRMNPVAVSLTGWSEAEAYGRELDEVIRVASVDRQPLDDLVGRIAAGTASTPGEHLVLTTRSGQERMIADTGAPIRTEHGVEVGLVLVLRDISGELALQEQLHQKRKMEAVGQLAGGVAHDFNNMLGGIIGAADLLLTHLDPQDEKPARLANIVIEAAERGAGLTQQLLAFARKQAVASSAVSVHDIIVATVDLLQNTIDKRVAIHLDLAAEQDMVVGEPSQLQSAFLNLGINAWHAMGDGGDLTFATSCVERTGPVDLGAGEPLPAGSYLQVTVSDTGSGIAAEHLAHIFEPFFTTKGEGMGTGLGLAAVFGTVRQHKGSIAVDSQPEAGTRFTILLPISSTPRQRCLAPEPQSAGRAQAARILVIDDEELMRVIVKATLENLGYTVITAVDGAEGLERLRAEAGAIDLVILDMVMPVMNGPDCLRAIRAIDGELPVIIASGFSHDEDLQPLFELGVAGHLLKPYRGVELGRMVAQALSPA